MQLCIDWNNQNSSVLIVKLMHIIIICSSNWSMEYALIEITKAVVYILTCIVELSVVPQLRKNCSAKRYYSKIFQLKFVRAKLFSAKCYFRQPSKLPSTNTANICYSKIKIAYYQSKSNWAKSNTATCNYSKLTKSPRYFNANNQ